MLHTKSESDIASLAPSSPSRAVYYVQSPSRDSHDGDKSSMQATPMYNSPMESPSHPSSFGRHSRNSSASRFSGIFRSSSGRKGGGGGGGRKRNDKGWPECNVMVEEGKYGEFDDGDTGFTRRLQVVTAVFTLVLLFTLFCLIIWGASRPYKPEIAVKSLALHNIYVGEGLDLSGVPTKLLTVNGSLRMDIYNPATFFGIHVSASPVNLMFSEIKVAAGQFKKYYQPRKSHRTVSVNLEGNKIPLYGAGWSVVTSNNIGEVPFSLEFQLRSRGDVVGKLVRSTHHRQVSCSLLIDTSKTKPIKFSRDSCTYGS